IWFSSDYQTQSFWSRKPMNKIAIATETSSSFIYKILVGQGVDWNPRGFSLASIVTLWFIAAFIFSNMYKSNLMATFAAPNIQLPFDTFDELADTDIPLMVGEGVKIHQVLMAAKPDSTLGRIWTQSITTTRTNYLLQQIQSGRAAGTGLGSTVDFLIHHEFSQKATCTLYKASECILKTGLSFVFQKGSKLKEKIDPVIVNLKEFEFWTKC
ncbi:unnamed protein product, partial [Meganyctiphanes norvegica]